jgi:energy-coupling factor transport system substrate-specific component
MEQMNLPVRKNRASLTILVTAGVFAAIIALLFITALWRGASFAFVSFLFIILMLVPFYFSFESRRPQARELVPIAVLSAVAALGRVAFAPFPDVKPTSAVVIIAGVAFGPQAGFITGATAALASNIFFGQGPFTPWQMFAWGIMGFAAGLFSKLLQKRVTVCVFGFAFAFIYGWIMDLWQVLGYVNPITPQSVLLTYAASFYFDLTHAVATAVFLLLLARPWLKILERVKIKYGLMQGQT